MSSNRHLFQPGKIIRDRYEILEELGSGGFATTYKAFDRALSIPVALKIYHHSSFSGQEDATKEAKIAAGFYDLEGIASARDFFEEDDIPCIVMEYVHGINIKEYVKQNGRIRGDKMLLMLKPLLQSLIRIHEKGILHRDISADNILLTEDGKLKLIDFGAARLTQKAKGEEFTLIFKRGFAPIEQCSSGGKQGPWTDVYGICATMYYMVTGIIPTDSVNRLINDTLIPLPRIDGTGLTSHEMDCIMKGLAVRPEERYSSMAFLYAGLYGDSSTDKLLSKNDTNPSSAISVTESNFTEKLINDITDSLKKQSFLRISKKFKLPVILFLLILLVSGAAARYLHPSPASRDFISTTASPVPTSAEDAYISPSPAVSPTNSDKPAASTLKPTKSTPKPTKKPQPSRKPISPAGTPKQNPVRPKKPSVSSSAKKQTTVTPSVKKKTKKTPKKSSLEFDGDLDGL